MAGEGKALLDRLCFRVDSDCERLGPARAWEGLAPMFSSLPWVRENPGLAEDLASWSWHILDSCVHGHSDIGQCAADIARLLSYAAAYSTARARQTPDTLLRDSRKVLSIYASGATVDHPPSE